MNLYSVLFGDVVIPDDRQIWKAQAYDKVPFHISYKKKNSKILTDIINSHKCSAQAHQLTPSLSAKYGQNVSKLKNGHHAQTSKSQQ